MISISILRAKNVDSFDRTMLSRTRKIQFIALGITFEDYSMILIVIFGFGLATISSIWQDIYCARMKLDGNR
ncbi:hypothetical protein KR100_09775 [Synechococcus sp. KORDI-100]|nr:hypothetical protein KR100_09775 [Synechococcus sp. KORDI-100]